MGSHRTSDFDYHYPPEAVAQRPLDERAASRLLILERATGRITHCAFGNLPTLISGGDVVVINTSKVVPARLIGTRENGREAEVLLIHEEPDGTWLAMVHPGGKLKQGRTVTFGDDAVVTIVAVLRGGVRRVRIDGSLTPRQLMERRGQVPLPPYIHRQADESDRDHYQTVYAAVEGSVAAPTAGLHFTPDILARVKARGATVAEIVLHVGIGTFKPVQAEDPENHTMHAEWYSVPDETAAAVNAARGGGTRVWAVGTTAVRTLETAGSATGTVQPGSGWTDLFIHPPYSFKIVDALVTNFHLPRSTLLMLVAAFAGYDETMQAYHEAIATGYRLYSYGDAMAIV